MIDVNGVQVIRAQVSLPASGAWSALVYTSEPFDAGSVVITDSETGPWLGTVTRSGGSSGVYTSRIIGGFGGLAGEVSGQHFRSLPVSAILSSLTSPLSEVPSLFIDPAVSGQVLSFFSVYTNSLAACLGDLADTAGVVWRIGQDGGVWLGTGRIPGPPFDVDLRVNAVDVGSGQVAVICDGLEIWPGDDLAGFEVKSVEYYFESGATRALVRI